MQAAPADNSRLPRSLFDHKRLKDTPRFQAKATFATPGINIVPLRSTAPDSSNRLTAWSAARAPKIATTAHRRARKGSLLTGAAHQRFRCPGARGDVCADGLAIHQGPICQTAGGRWPIKKKLGFRRE